ncbi:hypothetical protein GQX74_005306 [Glossina fuscipes]|nr:hypothetical protein GQX74_005306 [Glossina fuscipes]
MTIVPANRSAVQRSRPSMGIHVDVPNRRENLQHSYRPLCGNFQGYPKNDSRGEETRKGTQLKSYNTPTGPTILTYVHVFEIRFIMFLRASLPKRLSHLFILTTTFQS